MARSEYAALALIASAGWLGACQTESSPPAPLVQNARTTAPAAPLAWASAPDCRAKLGLLEQAVRTGPLAAGERPPIVVVLPGDPHDGWLASPGVTIAADLPLAVHERGDLPKLDAPCVLMIEQPRDQRVEHRLTGRETVRSFYESGVRTERNPDYDLAQLRVRQAEREARDDGPGILGVGDPMLDLLGTLVGGVVSGFSQGRHERELEEAMLELTSTPRSHDRPIYRAYEFEQTTVLAGKEATIPIALLDRLSGHVWRAELRQRERREFAIIDGLDPRDRDYEARRAASLDRHEFERWQHEPPRLQLSMIAAALHDTHPTVPPSGLAPPSASSIVSIADRRPDLPPIEPHDLDAALALPTGAADRAMNVALARSPVALPPAAGHLPRRSVTATQATSGGESRAAGVVAILADQGSGSGVYVHHDLVLTTAAAVEDASVADVVTADGGRVLGLVARRDPLRNLALIKVGRPGPPVTLHDRTPLADGRAIEAIVRGDAGEIRLAPGRYVGTGPATGLTMPTFVDLTYIEAPTLPDPPEATPWFLGDELIALGTGSAVDRPGTPRGAIGAGEILDFLYGPGGALAALR
jgi:hypothetical protein